MFKLLLLVTVISSQASMPFEHINSPFPTEEACRAAIEETRESTVAFFESQVGPVTAEFECVAVSGSLSKADRGADEIVRTLRLMIRQGGFGSSPR